VILKIVFSIVLLTIVSLNLIYGEEMPQMAKPGQCFTKSFFPPEYRKTTRTTSTKKVKLSESTIKYEVIPAKYSWYEERIKVSDGKEEIIVTPATYKRVFEKVLIEPSKKVWRRGLGLNSPKAFNSCVESASKSGMNIDTAKVGTCFYEHYIPEKYATTTEKILTSEASKKIISIPAKYRNITKKIMTSQSTMKLTPVPIKYKKVKEKVVVAPAKTEWKKTTCQNRGCNQSEVICLIDVPKQYKTVTKKVILKPAVAKEVAVSPIYKSINVEELVEPARTKVIPIPAKYKSISRREKVSDDNYFWSDISRKDRQSRMRTQCDRICLTQTPAKYKRVEKRVVVTPASSKKIKTPAKYTVVKVKKILKPASFKTVTIPAEYETVRVEKERTKGFSKWIPIVCESNLNKTLVKKVQKALKREGFYTGEINGVWDLESKSATRAYQRSKGLAVTRLSVETMKSLGIY